MPLQTIKKDGATVKATATSAKAETAKVAAAVQAELPVENTENKVYGNKSDTLIFIAPLGDPSRDDTTNKTLEDGTKKKIVKPTIVGYAFKSTEDIVIPDCGTQADLADNLMSYDNISGERAVKAGEVFYLTKFEAGCLLSREEYDGRATGGEKPVICTYTKPGQKAADGTVQKISNTAKIPGVALRAVSGSITDYDMIEVLSVTKETRSNGSVKKTRTMNPKPEFQKWAPLCAVKVKATTKSGMGATKANTRNKSAAAFLQIVNARKAQQK